MTDEERRPIDKKTSSMMLAGMILATAIFGSTVFLIWPFIPETSIIVELERDNIQDVYIESRNVPLIYKILKPPAEQITGAYTLQIHIPETVEYFELSQVAAGSYRVFWMPGTPFSPETEAHKYTIKVNLFKSTSLIDEFEFTTH